MDAAVNTTETTAKTPKRDHDSAGRFLPNPNGKKAAKPSLTPEQEESRIRESVRKTAEKGDQTAVRNWNTYYRFVAKDDGPGLSQRARALLADPRAVALLRQLAKENLKDA